MAKEILLYTSINSYSVSDFISQLESAKDGDVTIRMNTPGGSVYDGYGAIAKFKEFPNDKTIKVDGRADSFGAYFLCFCPQDSVECLDVSTFTFHRAAMPSWYESDATLFNDAAKASLTKINDTLRAGIESKVTAKKWKAVTGVSLDDMFSLNSRIDVPLNAEQAKKLGLIGKVNTITPEKLAEIKAYSLDLAAELTPKVIVQPQNSDTMTIQEVKSNKEVFDAIKAEILTDEKDRIAAFAEFADIDPKAVLEAITKGDKFTHAFGAKMTVKAMSTEGKKNLVAASAPAVDTAEVVAETEEEKTAREAKEKATASFDNINANVAARFGITTKA